MDEPVNRTDTGGGKVDVRDPGTGRFALGNKQGGRPRMDPEVRTMLEGKTKDAVEKLIQCLEAERAIVVGNGKDAHTEMVPDYDLQLKAANAILDRAYGKPAVALTDGDGGPLRMGLVMLPAESSGE